MKNTTIWVVVILVILVVLAGGIFFMFQSTNIMMTPSTSNSNTPATNNQITTTTTTTTQNPPPENTQTQNTQPSVTNQEDNPKRTYNIDIQNYKFSPVELRINKGDTVIWTNMDSVSHTVTSTKGNELDSSTLSKGQTFRYTFDETGTFSYYCKIHPMMKGTITVLDNSGSVSSGSSSSSGYYSSSSTGSSSGSSSSGGY